MPMGHPYDYEWEENPEVKPNEVYTDLEENLTWNDIEDEWRKVRSAEGSTFIGHLKRNFKVPERL